MSVKGKARKSEGDSPDMAVAEKSVPVKKSEKMEFVTWFARKRSEDKKLRPEQRHELEVYFKEMGLGNKASLEEYEEAYLTF